MWNKFFSKKKSIPDMETRIVEMKIGEKEAKYLFERARTCDANAQVRLADIFMDEEEMDYAFKWYSEAAKHDNADALYKLALFYKGVYDYDLDADMEKAESLLVRAMEYGHAEAIYRIAGIYEYNRNDITQAYEYYEKAAELGHAYSKEIMGRAYLEGEVFPKDEERAFYWFSNSNNYAYCYYDLGRCYLYGIGTDIDVERAVDCLEKAESAKCTELSETRRMLIDLYSKGYGGANSQNKLIQIQNNMDRYDRLISDYVALIANE